MQYKKKCVNKNIQYMYFDFFFRYVIRYHINTNMYLYIYI